MIAGRESLEARYNELKSRYADGEVPRPENWGGYLVVPDVIEFWQGRPNRLHDRLLVQQAGQRLDHRAAGSLSHRVDPSGAADRLANLNGILSGRRAGTY